MGKGKTSGTEVGAPLSVKNAITLQGKTSTTEVGSALKQPLSKNSGTSGTEVGKD